MMTEQGKQGNDQQDAFAVMMGPIVLEQAEKALAKAVMSHVARVAVTKVMRSTKTVTIVMNEGRTMLIELAQWIYGINQEQATVVIDDAIVNARHALRKAA